MRHRAGSNDRQKGSTDMPDIPSQTAMQAASELEDTYLSRAQYATAAMEVLAQIPFEHRAVIRLHYLRDFRKYELGLTNIEFNNIVRTLQTIAGTMHRCKKCNELKPANKFSAGDGAGLALKRTCGDCYFPPKKDRKCKSCGITKPVSAFNGRGRSCRDCAAASAAPKVRKISKPQENTSYVTPEVKWCNKCQTTKPAGEFYRNRKYLQTYCKACDCAASRERYRRVTHLGASEGLPLQQDDIHE